MLKNRFFVFWLILAFVYGLLYVLIVPPGWHYDEPGHFEFAWQIAKFDHWPQPGEYDNEFRRIVAQDLLRYRYYEWLPPDMTPDLKRDDPIFIGAAPQTTRYPLYYLIISLPLRFMHTTNYTLQTYLLRGISLLMWLVTLWLIWKTLLEIFPKEPLLVKIAFSFLVLLPGFVDTMTSINDDVGAVLGFSVFLYFAIRILRRGLSFRDLVGMLIGLGLSFWMKNTAWIAFPLALLVLIFAPFRQKYRWLPWVLTFLVLVAIGVLLTSYLQDGAARGWMSRTESKVRAPESIGLGEYALAITQRDGGIVQVLPPVEVQRLRGKGVTIGAWLWADRPAKGVLPVLSIQPYDISKPVQKSPAVTVQIGIEPKFYATTWNIPEDATQGRLTLFSVAAPDVKVFYDGVFLVEGEFFGQPEALSADGKYGRWQGSAFSNLLRNASFEQGAFSLSPRIKQIRRYYPSDFNIVLASLQDPQGFSWLYRSIFSRLMQTFWARPAAARIELPAAGLSYNLLQFLSFLGGVGTVLYMWRWRSHSDKPLLFFLLATVLFSWGATFLRGIGDVLLVWARYSMPVILPASLLITIGWYEWLQRVGSYLKMDEILQFLAPVSFMFALAVVSLGAIITTFYWSFDTWGFALWVTLGWAVYVTAWLVYVKIRGTSLSTGIASGTQSFQKDR